MQWTTAKDVRPVKLCPDRAPGVLLHGAGYKKGLFP